MTTLLAIVVLVTVMLGFVSSLLGFITTYQQNKRLFEQGEATHTLVNSQHDEIVKRVNLLTNTLEDANVTVPKNGQT